MPVAEQADADVIVVGSGFGGAVAAARLAQAGFAVVAIAPRDLVRLLGSIRGVAFTRARRLGAVARFARFFVRGALRRP